MSRNGDCGHASARHIRLYVPYAEANTIRLRSVPTLLTNDTHVSWLYQIPGGWGWTVCRECRRRNLKYA